MQINALALLLMLTLIHYLIKNNSPKLIPPAQCFILLLGLFCGFFWREVGLERVVLFCFFKFS